MQAMLTDLDVRPRSRAPCLRPPPGASASGLDLDRIGVEASHNEEVFAPPVGDPATSGRAHGSDGVGGRAPVHLPCLGAKARPSVSLRVRIYILTATRAVVREVGSVHTHAGHSGGECPACKDGRGGPPQEDAPERQGGRRCRIKGGRFGGFIPVYGRDYPNDLLQKYDAVAKRCDLMGGIGF